MRTLAERIAALTQTRAAKLAAMQALTAKADSEGRTLEAAEQTTIDEHSDEIDRIDADLVRLERMQKQVAGARPVPRTDRAPRAEDATRQRANGGEPRVEIV